MLAQSPDQGTPTPRSQLSQGPPSLARHPPPPVPRPGSMGSPLGFWAPAPKSPTPGPRPNGGLRPRLGIPTPGRRARPGGVALPDRGPPSESGGLIAESSLSGPDSSQPWDPMAWPGCWGLAGVLARAESSPGWGTSLTGWSPGVAGGEPAGENSWCLGSGRKIFIPAGGISDIWPTYVRAGPPTFPQGAAPTNPVAESFSHPKGGRISIRMHSMILNVRQVHPVQLSAKFPS